LVLALLLFLRPTNLRRVTGRRDLDFITFCCYQRRALLSAPEARDFTVQILREATERFRFAPVGYVIMPEHVHTLIGESPQVLPAIVVQVFTQRVSLRMREKRREMRSPAQLTEEADELRRFWQRRYYDFNIHTQAKMTEKLEYIHANSLAEKLVDHPRDWPWSSWSYYFTGDGHLGWVRCEW
jgi:putative transposase